MIGVGVAIGIGIESKRVSFERERLDVYHAAVEYVGWVDTTAKETGGIPIPITNLMRIILKLMLENHGAPHLTWSMGVLPAFSIFFAFLWLCTDIFW